MIPRERLRDSDWLGDLRRLLADEEVTGSPLRCELAAEGLTEELWTLPAAFAGAGDAIVLLQPNVREERVVEAAVEESAWAKQWRSDSGIAWPRFQARSVARRAEMEAMLVKLQERNFLRSACDVGRGGIAVTLARAACEQRLGCRTAYFEPEWENPAHAFFGEEPLRVLVTCARKAHLALTHIVERDGRFSALPLGCVTEGEFALVWENRDVVCCDVRLLQL